ncbi:hypothetical protein CCP4SC76_5580017 [Gammaproteobacteria bacterium]
MLFVGTQSYNLDIYKQCAAHGVMVWTIDFDPAAARWGVPGRHFVGDIRDIARLASGLRFNIIIFNGILGFGINGHPHAEAAVEAMIAVAEPDGILMVGWNPGRTDNQEIEPFHRRLSATALGPLPAVVDFPPCGQVQPYQHRYEFFRVPPTFSPSAHFFQTSKRYALTDPKNG